MNIAASTASVLGDAAIQFHCAGRARLADDIRPTSLQKVLTLRSSTNLEYIALIRFSRLLTNNLQLGNNPSSAALIQPLLGDILETESLGSFSGAASDAPGFILALRLEVARAQLWQDNFTKIFGHGETFANYEFSGLRWNWGQSNVVWIIPAKDWLLVGVGNDFSTLQAEYLNQIEIKGRPVPALETNWLEADLNSIELGGWFRLLKPVRIKLNIALASDNLQIGARLLETEDIPWQFQPWLIPKELMRRGMISFTAGQNVAALLNVNPSYSELPGNPLTNQFYVWASDQMPLLNYMAWPVPEASNALKRLSTEAPAALNQTLKRLNGTEMVWRRDANQLVWMNMSLFAPFLQVQKANDTQYLLLSSFPLSESEPGPDSILDQIQGRTNLVYYDWEQTGPRLREWEILSKMIANRALKEDKEALADQTVETEWLNALTHVSGITQTEVTRVAPNELSITRRAPVGLTAVELVMLADWLCDANSGPIHSPPPSANKPSTPPTLRR